MKIKRTIITISFFVVVLLAVFGVVMLGTILHEFSHRQDLHKIVNDDFICALIIPGNMSLSSMIKSESPLGIYHYTFNDSNKEEIKEIGSWTEKKAYFINYIIGIFFIACYLIVLNEWSKKREFE